MSRCDLPDLGCTVVHGIPPPGGDLWYVGNSPPPGAQPKTLVLPMNYNVLKPGEGGLRPGGPGRAQNVDFTKEIQGFEAWGPGTAWGSAQNLGFTKEIQCFEAWCLGA